MRLLAMPLQKWRRSMSKHRVLTLSAPVWIDSFGICFILLQFMSFGWEIRHLTNWCRKCDFISSFIIFVTLNKYWKCFWRTHRIRTLHKWSPKEWPVWWNTENWNLLTNTCCAPYTHDSTLCAHADLKFEATHRELVVEYRFSRELTFHQIRNGRPWLVCA